MTQAYAKKLKPAGFMEEQAEVQAEALAGLVNEQLATRRKKGSEPILFKTMVLSGCIVSSRNPDECGNDILLRIQNLPGYYREKKSGRSLLRELKGARES